MAPRASPGHRRRCRAETLRRCFLKLKTGVPFWLRIPLLKWFSREIQGKPKSLGGPQKKHTHPGAPESSRRIIDLCQSVDHVNELRLCWHKLHLKARQNRASSAEAAIIISGMQPLDTDPPEDFCCLLSVRALPMNDKSKAPQCVAPSCRAMFPSCDVYLELS